MTIKVGDAFPGLTVQTVDENGAPAPLDLGRWTAGRTVVLFGVPGAFTPTCSVQHMPGFVENAPALMAAGVDAIGCHSQNDAFVMGAWATASNAGDIDMVADGSGELTRALGLELDLTGAGLGMRCQRYAMIIRDGEVTYLGVEPGQTFGVSSADAVLKAI